MFFTVKPEYWSCMGETALKKTKYNEDTAKARHQFRADQDALMLAMRSGQRVEVQTAQQQTQLQQVLAALPQPLVQNIILPAIRMVQAVGNFMRAVFQSPVLQNFGQAMGNAMAGLGKMVQNAASQILSFFFGHKKENDKTDEKHQRDRTDAATTDLFGKTMFNEDNVQGAENKFLGA